MYLTPIELLGKLLYNGVPDLGISCIFYVWYRSSGKSDWATRFAVSVAIISLAASPLTLGVVLQYFESNVWSFWHWAIASTLCTFVGWFAPLSIVWWYENWHQRWHTEPLIFLFLIIYIATGFSSIPFTVILELTAPSWFIWPLIHPATFSHIVSMALIVMLIDLVFCLFPAQSVIMFIGWRRKHTKRRLRLTV